MDESFNLWSDRVDLIPNHTDIAELARSFLNWREVLVPLVKGVLDEIAKAFGSDAAPAFQRAAYLSVNNSLQTSLERDLLQDKHEDGHMITVMYVNAPGLEIYVKGEGSEMVLPMMPAPNEVILASGSVLSAQSDGVIAPLYHHVRNHGLESRQSIVYFANPEIDEPLSCWVDSGEGERADIRELVRKAPLKFGLPPVPLL